MQGRVVEWGDDQFHAEWPEHEAMGLRMETAHQQECR